MPNKSTKLSTVPKKIDRATLERKVAAKLELDRRKCFYIPGDIDQSAKNCSYWINRFCYTFDPKREPYHFRFRLFPFQYDLVYEVVKAIMTGEDILIDKCREMGATYTIVDVLLWFWIFSPGSNFLVGSRKESFVDATRALGNEALSNKEESLFGKMEYTLSRMDPVAIPLGLDLAKHKTSMSLVNPENGNVISGESSNENFSRGGRQKAILLDEFAFWENDIGAWGSTADTTNCRIVLTTPGTRPSKAKRLRFGTDGEEIKVITLHHELDPRKDATWLERERRRRSKEDFAREIMIDWEGSLTGIVYPEIGYAEKGNYPYDPRWPLYCGWDFGLDGVSIIFIQRNLNSKRLRIIDYYENHDKTIDFYYPMLGREINRDNASQYTIDDIKAIRELRAYRNPTHFGDPDVAKRSLLVKSSTYHELEKAGITVITNRMSNDFSSRREQTKLILQEGVEINENERTAKWLLCMENARYPQRLETSQATTAVNLPIHDWTSHGRTAFEYFCVNFRAQTDAVPSGGVIKQSYDRENYPRVFPQDAEGNITTPDILDLTRQSLPNYHN